MSGGTPWDCSTSLLVFSKSHIHNPVQLILHLPLLLPCLLSSPLFCKNEVHSVNQKYFMQKAEYYRFFYNLRRPNYSKGAKSPALIAHQDRSYCAFSSFAVAFPTVDLDKINISLNLSQNDRRQTIPVFPVN
jgi:hypothetical protein